MPSKSILSSGSREMVFSEISRLPVSYRQLGRKNCFELIGSIIDFRFQKKQMHPISGFRQSLEKLIHVVPPAAYNSSIITPMILYVHNNFESSISIRNSIDR